MINTLLFLTSFIFIVSYHALSDGYKDKGKKFYSHFYSVCHILHWLLLLFFISYLKLEFHWTYVIMYVLVRFSIFDSIWNIINKQKLFYVGLTSKYDMFWRKIQYKLGWNTTHLLFWLKLISLLGALSFLTYKF